MSARDELLTTGRLGRSGALLLYNTVRLVVLARGFPPPENHHGWDEAAVQAVAHDFLQSTRGPKRLLDITLKSVDDRSFERILEAAVTNHLRDEARKTDLGKLIIRVKSILRSTAEFATDPSDKERWTLTGAGSEPSLATATELARATVGIAVVTPPWSSATRDSPIADRQSMVRLIHAVLIAADGSVTPADIARAIAARLDHRRRPLTIELDSADALSEIAAAGADPASTTASEIRAREIFDGLSDRERIVVATLDLNVRDLGSLIATGKSRAAHLRQRLLDDLRHSIEGDDDFEQTAGALAKLCDDWLQRWTGSNDPTSNNHIDGEGEY